MSIAVLIPAHNEAGSIAETIQGVLDQSRPADLIVVIPNGCTDETAEIARRYPVTVLELPRLPHRKSEALNIGWRTYCQKADFVVCLDADTVLAPNALADWADEFAADRFLGGTASKFTVRGNSLLARIQKAEFAKWSAYLLRRGTASVLSGTGSMFRNEALKLVAEGQDGPWAYTSQVEDFELTYRLRRLDWRCLVSPTVRAYTDSMPTVRAIWGQRMKWQTGTAEDLLRFGFNRYTRREWVGQIGGLLGVLSRALWLPWISYLLVAGMPVLNWHWQVLLLVMAASEVRQAYLIPHHDKWDILLAAALIPQEIFSWIRAAWFCKAWYEALAQRFFHRSRVDRWEAQYAAEGV